MSSIIVMWYGVSILALPTSHLTTVEVISLSSTSTVSTKGGVESGPEWITDQRTKVEFC